MLTINLNAFRDGSGRYLLVIFDKDDGVLGAHRQAFLEVTTRVIDHVNRIAFLDGADRADVEAQIAGGAGVGDAVSHSLRKGEREGEGEMI